MVKDHLEAVERNQHYSNVDPMDIMLFNMGHDMIELDFLFSHDDDVNLGMFRFRSDGDEEGREGGDGKLESSNAQDSLNLSDLDSTNHDNHVDGDDGVTEIEADLFPSTSANCLDNLSIVNHLLDSDLNSSTDEDEADEEDDDDDDIEEDRPKRSEIRRKLKNRKLKKNRFRRVSSSMVNRRRLDDFIPIYHLIQAMDQTVQNYTSDNPDESPDAD